MEINCTTCGSPFQTKRPKQAKYCSPKCTKRGQRSPSGKAKATILVLSPPVEPDVDHDEAEANDLGSCAATTARDLSKVGRLDTPLGQAAMVLARRIDNPSAESGAGLSSLAKQLEATLAAATKGSDEKRDVLDEIRDSAARKFAGIPAS